MLTSGLCTTGKLVNVVADDKHFVFVAVQAVAGLAPDVPQQLVHYLREVYPEMLEDIVCSSPG